MGSFTIIMEICSADMSTPRSRPTFSHPGKRRIPGPPWSAPLDTSSMRHSFVTVTSALLLLSGVFRADAIIDATLQMQLGNPSGATADPNNHNHYLIQRTVEAIDYSDNLGEPNCLTSTPKIYTRNSGATCRWS